MAYKICYSDEVLADLEEVADYAKLNFPASSQSFLPGLLDQIELLALYPKMGPIANASPPLHRLLYSPFVIYYEIAEDQQRIDILHIWHGSRRPPKFSR